MTGRHRRGATQARGRTVQMVDARTGIEHHLTPDALALALGRKPTGRFIALCGDDVLPAALIAPPDRLGRTCIRIPAR